MSTAPPTGDSAASGANTWTAGTTDRVLRAVATQPELPPVGVPGYQLIREIHRGGQGIVCLALQESTHRHVAIKFLREGQFDAGADRVRFEREIHILASLKHPHIVTIHDSGHAAGFHYLVMDYIVGHSFGDFLADADRPPGKAPRTQAEKLRVFVSICEAIEAAHQRDVVHRDLKPSNIRVDPDGRPFVLDFGLAKPIGVEASDGEGIPGVTITGQFVGSLPWASPEQAEGRAREIDARSDVYSLGVMLYQLASGAFPYDVTGEMLRVQDRIVHAPPRPPRSVRAGVPRDLETIILRCLAKEPERRYATAGALGRDLERFLGGEPIEARRDSLTYVLRKKARQTIGRNRIASVIAIVAVTVLLSEYAGGFILLKSSGVGRAVEKWLIVALAPAATAPLEHVRVIGFRDDTPYEALAAEAGLQHVTTRDNKSLRRLHGAMMKRLCGSGARAVTWDVAFAGETPHDAYLVEGVDALRKCGVEVVVCVKSWWLDGRTQVGISPRIGPAVRWGYATGYVGEQAPWSVHLVAQRGHSAPLASLALATLAAARHPFTNVRFSLDREHEAVDLSYWETDPRSAQAQRWLPDGDHVELSTLSSERPVSPPGVQNGDLLGSSLVVIPTNDVLAAATLDYTEVFRSNPEQLRELLGERVALFADLRTNVDVHPYPDGRRVPGCYAHAMSIEALLRAASICRPRGTHIWLILIASAVVGVAAERLPWRGMVARGFVLLGTTMLFVTASMAVFGFLEYLCSPLLPLVAMGSSYGLAWLSSKA